MAFHADRNITMSRMMTGDTVKLGVSGREGLYLLVHLGVAGAAAEFQGSLRWNVQWTMNL